MAVYKRVGGRELDSFIAHMPEVVAAVAEESVRVEAVARGILAASDPPSGVKIERGSDGITDSYVYLSGPPGLTEAFEFGRNDFIAKKAIFMGPDAKYPEGRFVSRGTLVRGFAGKHVLRKTWEAS